MRLVVAAHVLHVFALWGCSVQPEPKPDFVPWTWSECLPSAVDHSVEATEMMCDGEKPSWELYRTQGIIVWRYALGNRSIYQDEHATWRIYDRAYCLNYWGDTVGTLVNVGFRSAPHRHDPVTGLMPMSDQYGPLSGEVLSIYGVINDEGKVAPLMW